jgi:hypothetical protein
MTNNRSANAILSREWRLFKPLAWMVFVGLALLAAATAFGAVKGEPKPKPPALVVLNLEEKVMVSDVSVTPLEAAPAALPDGTAFVSGFNLQLSTEAAFSHPVQLNLSGVASEHHRVLRLETDGWKDVESAVGTRAGVGRTASTQRPGTYVLVASTGQTAGS